MLLVLIDTVNKSTYMGDKDLLPCAQNPKKFKESSAFLSILHQKSKLDIK